MNSVLFNEQPVIPSKVICIGRNYAKHVAELNNVLTGDMVVFMKPNSSVSQELTSYHQEPLHYEGEIAFIIKDAQFAGVAFALDLTKRELQSSLKEKKLPWERAKSFDGAAVFDRFIPLPPKLSFLDLFLELWIDGQLAQKGGVAEMLFSPSVILEDLKTFLTLEDGDIVMTGTPEGVGEVKQGAEFKGRILLADEILIESCWTAK
jgi:2-keto-4-pentenoate hydratase/2-oxohepta-3-ene-1,7-dioic acid hydratase in catechol pathway